jgi:hypothetical protein
LGSVSKYMLDSSSVGELRTMHEMASKGLSIGNVRVGFYEIV